MLADNRIGDEGAKALAPALGRLTGLTTLYLYSEWGQKGGRGGGWLSGGEP